MLYRFLFCLLLSFSLLPLSAQGLVDVRHYSTENGLSQNVIQSIIQDADGYIWAASWNGLEKYDGYTFTNYKSYPTDSVRLPYNRLLQIARGDKDQIWCLGYDNKVYLFNTHRETFEDPCSYHPELTSCHSVKQIIALPGGIAWGIGNDGNLWRFDSHRLREKEGMAYYPVGSCPTHGNQVYTIHADPQGREWILTNQGCFVHGKKELFCEGDTRYIAHVAQTTYLTCGHRLMAYLPEKGMHEIKVPDQKGYLCGLFALPDNRLFIATTRSLVIYNPADGTFNTLYLDEKENNIFPQKFFLASDGTLWMFDGFSRMIVYDWQQKKMEFRYWNPTGNRRNNAFIHEDSNGLIWILPPLDELQCYHPQQQRFVQAYTLQNGKKNLYTMSQGTGTQTYLFDTHRNLWCCHNTGFDKISFLHNDSGYLTENHGTEARGLFIDSRQRVWVADKSGRVEVYDQTQNYIGNLSPSGQLVPDKEIVFGADIYCFFEDKEQRLWLGSKKGGLYVAQPNGNGFRLMHYLRQTNDPYSLSSNSIYAIQQDNKGRIWIATYGGGLNLVTGTLPSIRFLHPYNELSHYTSQQQFLNARHLCYTSTGVMMVATTDGLVTFSTDFTDVKEIKFHYTRCDINDSKSLANNDVLYLYESRSGEIYVVTYSGGVSRILSKNLLADSLHMTHLNKKNGLPSDIAYALVEGEEGELWITFETCICRYYPRTNQMESYDRFNLNTTLFLSEVPPVKDNHQTMYIGTTQGTLYVHLNRLHKSTFVPPIVFTRAAIRKSDNTTHLLPIEENSLTLQKDERNIMVSFAALDYTNTENLHYAYRLKGVNDEWIYIDENHATNLVNLPTGEFDLEVKSTNGDGIWTDNITRLKLHILPTFWETGWAWLLYIVGALLVMGTVSGIIVYILNLQRKVDFEQQLTNLKLRFFTDISHELRTPLTLIAAPVEEVLEREHLSPHGEENMLVVKRNTHRMLRLINQLLDFRRIQNNKMSLYIEQVDAIALLRHTFDNFIGLAHQRNIDFRFISPIESLKVYTDADKLEKILFNLLSNAFKYTPDGKSIRLTIAHEGDTLKFDVTDEGKGLDLRNVDLLFNRFETLGEYKRGNSSGIGLSLVHELITLLHGKIQVESALGRGSTFTVSLPTAKECFAHDKNVEFILHDGTNERTEKTPVVRQTDTPNDQTVLIVEDNQELCHFIASILQEEYQVLTAKDGVEGFNLIKTHLPDLIVSDIMMPQRDGIEMLSMTRNDHDTSHIPVILLSAKTTLEDRIKGLEYGADDYITKPFSANYLKARIASLLKQRKAWKKLFTEVQPTVLAEAADATLAQEEKSGCPTPITHYDEEFIKKVAAKVEEQLNNQEFKIEDLAETMNLSRTVFYRKIKSILGVSPKDFVRDMRIKKAVEMLNTGLYSISEIAYQSGFSSPQYFSRVFREVMNCTPSEYKMGDTTDPAATSTTPQA